jgi:hypothetical protein
LQLKAAQSLTPFIGNLTFLLLDTPLVADLFSPGFTLFGLDIRVVWLSYVVICGVTLSLIPHGGGYPSVLMVWVDLYALYTAFWLRPD